MRAAFTLALGVSVAALAIAACAQESVEQGRKSFMDNGCYGCHLVGKTGTPIGPNLSSIGAKYSRSYLEGWLRDPSAQRPNAHMPRLELSEQQVKDLATFLSSLR